jgi:protein-L-isoaspartate(D-aspartate) O-methyltransferase
LNLNKQVFSHKSSQMLGIRKIIRHLTWILFLITQPFIMAIEAQENNFRAEREEMVYWQLVKRNIKNEQVLDAFLKVKRHLFVPERYAAMAYEDRPLPIGHNQTISQPYIVAYMVETADIQPEERVLEIGTGSGYQAAILGEIAKEVYTIEIIEELGRRARRLLHELGYDNVHVKIGDGYEGWPEHAPFDAILVTAAIAEVPEPLIEQLAEDGRMLIPVGDPKRLQYLELLRKRKGKIRRERLVPVRFVPFTRN